MQAIPDRYATRANRMNLAYMITNSWCVPSSEGWSGRNDGYIMAYPPESIFYSERAA
jgi:hypothetical protein